MACKEGGGGVCQEYDEWGRYLGGAVSGAQNYYNDARNATANAIWRFTELFVNHDGTINPLKGTYFFGGAGMDGDYIEDIVKALREVGVSSVQAVDPQKWSTGTTVTDAIMATYLTSRDFWSTDFSLFGQESAQFNLIGYSYGSEKAAQAALDYADVGGVVDHLVRLLAVSRG